MKTTDETVIGRATFRKFGTVIRYDSSTGVGVVKMEDDREVRFDDDFRMREWVWPYEPCEGCTLEFDLCKDPLTKRLGARKWVCLAPKFREGHVNTVQFRSIPILKRFLDTDFDFVKVCEPVRCGNSFQTWLIFWSPTSGDLVRFMPLESSCYPWWNTNYGLSGLTIEMCPR